MRAQSVRQVVLGCSLAALGLWRPAEAQSITRRPSMLWQPAAPMRQAPTYVRPADGSAKERGLLIGGVIGGVAAGILGNRICRAYGTTGGCTGQTLWWAAAGGLLGGLIGATGAGDSSAPSRPRDSVASRAGSVAAWRGTTPPETPTAPDQANPNSGGKRKATTAAHAART